MLRIYHAPIAQLATFIYPEWHGLSTITHIGDLDDDRYFHVDEDIPLPTSDSAAFIPISETTELIQALRAVAPATVLPLLVSRSELIVQVAEKINIWRDEQEQVPIVFEHAGHLWDGGLRVRARLQPTLRAANLAGLPDGFFWTDADNRDVPLTISELADLDSAHEAAIVAQGWRIHARQRAMKQALADMSTPVLTEFEPCW